jgi:hypothetical protein
MYYMPFMPEILVRAPTPTDPRSAVFANLGTAQRALMFGCANEVHKVDGGCFQVESVELWNYFSPITPNPWLTSPRLSPAPAGVDKLPSNKRSHVPSYPALIG